MKRILIVGAGPVGLMTANYLCKHGIEFEIIDKNLTSTTYSKALSVNPATLKVFHGLNLADTLIAKGKKIYSISAYYEGKRFLNINNNRIKSLFNFHLSIPQPETEKVLEDNLNDKNIHVTRGLELCGMHNDEKFVTVKFQNQQGEIFTRQYDYVLGCDGANSLVRKLSDIHFSGHDYPMHFVMADVRFNQPVRMGTSYHIQKEGFLIFLPMPDNMVRIVVKKEGALPDPRPVPDLKEINEHLAQYCSSAGNAAELVWSSSANFFNRIATTNVKGRVILAGDAFHLFSPIGGQGMNTGIQDAVNVAWKLAWIVKKISRESIIESYKNERFVSVNNTLSSTDYDTYLISGMGNKDNIPSEYFAGNKNRDFYRDILPVRYSGFYATQSEDTNTYKGRHVPFYFFQDLEAIPHTYTLIQNGKVTILGQEPCKDLTQGLQGSDEIIFLSLTDNDARFLESIGIGKDEYCVINPDGYIGFLGKKSELRNYLNKNYLAVAHA